MIKLLSKSEKETQRLATKIATFLKGGEILALSGNLGSGKTTFVRGLAKGLKIRDKIKSPGFVILSPHQIPNRMRRPKTFYHLDLYRIKDPDQELIELGFAEIAHSPKNILVIEWAEKAKKLLPKRAVSINFARGKAPNERIISL